MKQKASPLLAIIESKDSSDADKNEAAVRVKELADTLYAQICPSNEVLKSHAPIPGKYRSMAHIIYWKLMRRRCIRFGFQTCRRESKTEERSTSL